MQGTTSTFFLSHTHPKCWKKLIKSKNKKNFTKILSNNLTNVVKQIYIIILFFLKNNVDNYSTNNKY